MRPGDTIKHRNLGRLGTYLSISAALFLNLWGCTHPQPARYHNHLPNMPPNWTAPGKFDAKGDALAWLDQFKDPQLTGLVEEALENNYDLRVTALRMESARAEALLAGASRRPTFSAGVTAGRSSTPVQGLQGVETEASRSHSLAASMRWELDLWGRLGDSRKAALKDVTATEEDWHAARLSLAGQVVKAWYQVIADNRQLELAKHTLKSYQLSTRLVRSGFERGIVPALDLRLALSSVAEAEERLHERANQLSGSKRNLQILLQRYPDDDLLTRGTLPEVKQTIPVGLPSQILERRADIRAAKERLLAMDLRTSAARKAFLPDIALTADTGTSSKELKDLLNGDYSFWNLLSNLTQPIFQGGRLRANLSLAQTASETARLQYAQTVFIALNEVEQTLTAEHFFNKRIAASHRAAEQAAGAEKLALEAYAAGITDIVTVLEAQRRVLNAKVGVISVRRAQLQNRADIALALGGNFDEAREVK